ncbi:phosphoribosylglycinamide formyltransferase, chloroplastic-like [Dioscorea cayenensis subsp. rotundata]|uniref:Phosphoribosylglycinamide formyltransferase, chloroplastic n=1 Tax=Dioscorea cayennensis subsp. rotundata TaxID=55577 RepID=A0AB40BR47_DIOCR|nr:phosphoribosylglycinamide formyltransferase, chloroplastic-like [Dioscorea cayenensis subsp. rotundata]
MESLSSAIAYKPSLNSGEIIDLRQRQTLASQFNCSFPNHKVIFCKTCSANNLALRNTWNSINLFQCRSNASHVEGPQIENDTVKELRRKKLGIFVSGGGSNFQAIHDASSRGLIHGDVSVLVTDKASCGGAEYARDKGIPVLLFPRSKNCPEGLSSIDLINALRTFEVDFLLLAGYLKLIPTELVQAYPKCILNIHPSLLPAFGGKGFYGMKVHRAVIASGARFSGPTVHFVDEHYDTGLILAQRVVPVLANDTPEQLAARVLHEEHNVYAEVVAALCEDRIVWRDDGVPLIRSKANPHEYY